VKNIKEKDAAGESDRDYATSTPRLDGSQSEFDPIATRVNSVIYN